MQYVGGSSNTAIAGIFLFVCNKQKDEKRE